MRLSRVVEAALGTGYFIWHVIQAIGSQNAFKNNTEIPKKKAKQNKTVTEFV